ncbi:hypothetical protein GDO81_001064 [Engystomops pustulosus]|uniref:Uncharacterized protein n=1 Tax=Engystomops pustulosus TaxID=76066 RepID=A0AAV7D9I1_ENGPU|nr:hypothetical protein GDO81_001064 [Engystomops pustulosus]
MNHKAQQVGDAGAISCAGYMVANTHHSLCYYPCKDRIAVQAPPGRGTACKHIQPGPVHPSVLCKDTEDLKNLLSG